MESTATRREWLRWILTDADVGHFYNPEQRAAFKKELDELDGKLEDETA